MTLSQNSFERILAEVSAEVKNANAQHMPLNSHHEAYAVILEELEEYWEIVRQKARNRDNAEARRELIQVAAMAVRAINNLEIC